MLNGIKYRVDILSLYWLSAISRCWLQYFTEVYGARTKYKMNTLFKH
jgi:hypothetical protein